MKQKHENIASCRYFSHYLLQNTYEMESNKVESPSKWEKLKGIVSRDESFIWRLFIKNTYVLSVHAPIVFTNFCFSLEWKNKTQSFSLLLWNYLLILKILPITLFKDAKAAILTRKPPVNPQNNTESHRWQVNSRAFSLQPMRGRH
jgi:hypothetical protein